MISLPETSIVRISNASRPNNRPVTAKICRSFGCRFKGLMFQKTLGDEEGLLLVLDRPSRLDAGIHMLFMRMDLAVVWIDENGVVVDARKAYKWRSLQVPRAAARFTLELPLETAGLFRIGDEVHFD